MSEMIKEVPIVVRVTGTPGGVRYVAINGYDIGEVAEHATDDDAIETVVSTLADLVQDRLKLSRRWPVDVDRHW